MVEQLGAEDLTEFIDSLRSIVERAAAVYRASDHVELEICARKLKEHTKMLIAISLSQNSSLGELFKVLEVSFAMLLRKTSDILHASSIRPKENAPLAFSASTGGRPAYIITKEIIEQFRETEINWRSKYSNMPCNFRPNTIQKKDRVWSGKQFHRYYG